MIIYRVESKRGTGMYVNSSCWSVKEAMQEYERHPDPTQDAGLRDVWRDLYYGHESTLFSFGFATIAQLKSWIYRDDWRQILHDHGFAVYAYNAKTYHLGDTQAIFIKDSLPVGHFVLTALASAEEWFNSLEEEYNAPER